jgi:2-phosphoglycerate kinase
MLAVAFDTLKLARKLESAGMAPKQAQDMAAAISDSLTEWHSVGNLATKDDVHEVKAELGKLEAKFEAKLAEAKAEILKWMFGAIGTQTFILLAALFGLFHSVVKF